MPFIDVLPNYVGPVEHLRTFGWFSPLTETQSPIIGPSRTVLGYDGLLGAIATMTNLGGGLAIAGFILPQTILVAAGVHRLATRARAAATPRLARGRSSRSRSASRSPDSRDARGTVVVVPLVCLGLAVAAETLRRADAEGAGAQRPTRGGSGGARSIGMALGCGDARAPGDRVLRDRDRRGRRARPPERARRDGVRGGAHRGTHRAAPARDDGREHRCRRSRSGSAAGRGRDRDRCEPVPRRGPGVAQDGHRSGRRGRSLRRAASARSAVARSRSRVALQRGSRCRTRSAPGSRLVLESSGLLLVVLVVGVVARQPGRSIAGRDRGAARRRGRRARDRSPAERPRVPRRRAPLRGTQDGPLLALDDRGGRGGGGARPRLVDGPAALARPRRRDRRLRRRCGVPASVREQRRRCGLQGRLRADQRLPPRRAPLVSETFAIDLHYAAAGFWVGFPD